MDPDASQTVLPIALFGGLGMLTVGFAFTAYAARLKSWGYFLLGGAAWIVEVALKAALALIANHWVDQETQSLPPWIGAPLFWLYIGLLTGVTEVAITWIMLRYTRWGRANWASAMAFGLGFGTVECLTLASVSLGFVTFALCKPESMPEVALPGLVALNDPLAGLPPIWERFWTTWGHILTSLLIFYSIVTGKPRFFWAAFAYKSLIDAFAAAAAATLLKNAQSPDALTALWTVECVVGLWGAVGWAGVRWLKKRFPAPDPSAPESGPAGV
jgi:uncharacterized membrane protein YhfC